MSHWDKIWDKHVSTEQNTYIDTRCVIFLGNRQVENLMSAGYQVLFSGGTVSGHFSQRFGHGFFESRENDGKIMF